MSAPGPRYSPRLFLGLCAEGPGGAVPDGSACRSKCRRRLRPNAALAEQDTLCVCVRVSRVYVCASECMSVCECARRDVATRWGPAARGAREKKKSGAFVFALAGKAGTSTRAPLAESPSSSSSDRGGDPMANFERGLLAQFPPPKSDSFLLLVLPAEMSKGNHVYLKKSRLFCTNHHTHLKRPGVAS